MKYFYIKSLRTTDAKNGFSSTLGTSRSWFNIIKNWMVEFKHGCIRTTDPPRSRKHKTDTSTEMFKRVRRIVLEDSRLKLADIAEIVRISKERTHHILHQFWA